MTLLYGFYYINYPTKEFTMDEKLREQTDLVISEMYMYCVEYCEEYQWAIQMDYEVFGVGDIHNAPYMGSTPAWG